VLSNHIVTVEDYIRQYRSLPGPPERTELFHNFSRYLVACCWKKMYKWIIHTSSTFCIQQFFVLPFEQKEKMDQAFVRGHPSVSLPLLSSPTIPLIYPCLYVCSPHLCTIPRDHTQRPATFVFQVQRLPVSFSACTLAASDKPWTHWDRSAWHYGTLRHHVDGRLGTRRFGTVFLCISFVVWPSQGSLERSLWISLG
jgi:hypothetical protein